MSSIMGNISTEFESFGPSFLEDRAMGEPTEFTILPDRHASRQALREQCPKTPGIYGWINEDRQLIYVGKSKSLCHRLLSYFAKTPADPKAHRIRRAAVQIVWEPIAHELLALIREQELIHRWTPQYNSQGQPTRRQPAFICISDTPAPHAYVTKRLTQKSQEVFGPIVGSAALGESVEAFNHVFQLRDCPDKTKFAFSSQLTLFEEPPRAQCIRFELGSCPAPCARTCTPSEYKANVKRGLAFLNGQDQFTLARLEAQMQEAAARHQFERAAVLRNQWQALSRLDRQLGRLRRCAETIHGVMTCPVSPSRRLWTVFRGGRVAATLLEPRSHRQAEIAKATLEAAAKQAVHPTSNILEINLQLIVASWFKKAPSELTKLVPIEEMVAECQSRRDAYRRTA